MSGALWLSVRGAVPWRLRPRGGAGRSRMSPVWVKRPGLATPGDRSVFRGPKKPELKGGRSRCWPLSLTRRQRWGGRGGKRPYPTQTRRQDVWSWGQRLAFIKLLNLISQPSQRHRVSHLHCGDGEQLRTGTAWVTAGPRCGLDQMSAPPLLPFPQEGGGSEVPTSARDRGSWRFRTLLHLSPS